MVSWGYEAEKPGPSQFVDYHEWWGTRDVAAFLSVPAAIEFQEKHDWPKVQRACHELACQTIHKLEGITGLPSLYFDDDWYGQMFSTLLPANIDIDKAKTRLYDEYRIEVPLIDWNGHRLIRVSIQGYNTASDANRLIHAVEHLL